MSLIQEILQHHENELFDTRHVFYSNSKENPLLFVSFAGYKVEKYVSVTWFYQQNELLGNFLFLKDDAHNYSTYNQHKFIHLIQHYIGVTGATTTVFYGPSMGGMAAIRIGMHLNADLVIAIDPQLIHLDLGMFLHEIEHTENHHTRFYINFTFLEDSRNGRWEIPYDTKKIMDELQRKFMVLSHPYSSLQHLAFIPTRDYLVGIIGFYKNLHVKNHFPNVKNWF